MTVKKIACKIIIVLSVFAAPASWVWAGVNLGPVKIAGNLGYRFRDARVQGGGSGSSSHQVQAGLSAQSYLWQPWFATESLRLTLARDSTSARGSGKTLSNLLTGSSIFNLLPQSHTPFQLSYRVNDTKVDRISLAEVPVSFSGDDFNSARFSVKQSLLTDAGHRFQLRYDKSRWNSGVGRGYTDDVLGLEADLKFVKNRLVARVNQQNSRNELVKQKDRRFVINVDHDYVPSSIWRVDSMLNLLNENKSPTSGSLSSELGTIDSRQLSSFAFWRPDNTPLALSGGVRIYGVDTSGNGLSSTQGDISGSLGGFYQYDKHIRLDASLVVSRTSQKQVDGLGGRVDNTLTQTQQRLGGLYQSDMIGLGRKRLRGSVIFPWNYQWYADSILTNRTLSKGGGRAAFENSVGHNINRSWRQTERSFMRFGFSQRVNGVVDSGAKNNALVLNQSSSLSVNKNSTEGGRSAQLSFSDSRRLKGRGNNGSRQLINFQLAANHTVTRQSGLSGSVTMQHIRQQSLVPSNKRVTSLSGRVSFQHNRVLGISQLQFLSDLYASKAELSNSLNRAEWENRLSYVVGQTEMRSSIKFIDSGLLRYTLVYLQLTRNF